jgi:hypothetical protein
MRWNGLAEVTNPSLSLGIVVPRDGFRWGINGSSLF